MSDTNSSVRPVPRWLHFYAVLAAASTFFLFLLGQMVTSLKAGMADPVWPTEPWYLFTNYKCDFGYLIEHTHRIFGFIIGAEVIGLVLCLWFTEQKTSARWTALIGLAAIIAGYGEFHRNLMAQQQLNIPNSEMRLPVPAIAIMAIGLLLTVAIGVSRVSQRAPGAGIRLIGLVALVAVMIQGLLGGFRVKLNELVGTDLAAVHGIFAQVVMTILVLLAVRTERSPAAPPDSPGLRTIRLTSHILAALVFVQIVWGALVRHDPTPLNQRLHFLTAFLALALGVIVLRAIFVRPELRSQAGLLPAVMCGLLAVQIYLGVEAWMVKFGMYTLPELVPVTRENAAIRTLHALVGSALLMTSIGLMVRMGRRTPAERPNGDGGRTDWYEAEVVQNRVAVAAETYQGNTP